MTTQEKLQRKQVLLTAVGLAEAEREREILGGPGSGCSGSNCGRPAGSGLAVHEHPGLKGVSEFHGYKYHGSMGAPSGIRHVYARPEKNKSGTTKYTISTKSDGSWTHSTNPDKGDQVVSRGSGTTSLDNHLQSIHR